MSDTEQTPPQSESPASSMESDSQPTPETTVGTGTAMALGCIAGTILLIGFGLIFLFFASMR